MGSPKLQKDPYFHDKFGDGDPYIHGEYGDGVPIFTGSPNSYDTVISVYLLRDYVICFLSGKITCQGEKPLSKISSSFQWSLIIY